MMQRHAAILVALACAAGMATVRAAEPGPAEFAWRAPLQAPAGAPLVRVEVPATALLHLQSADLRDLRVFNAAGAPVPFALLAAPAVPSVEPERTTAWPALPLFSADARSRDARGSTQVRIEDARGGGSVFVHLDGREVTDSPRLNSALFATTGEKRLLGGIEVQGTIPANTPIQLTAFASADLAQWAVLPLRGRLYRFDGPGAPANMVLRFDAPVSLEHRFLRLDWGPQPGVTVSGVQGLVAPAATPPPRSRAPLPPAQSAGGGSLELETGFATPLAGLELATAADNTLWPVRILVRTEPAQPWRQVAQTVVYRLVNGSGASTNPSLPLRGARARWLRIEPTNGADLGQARLRIEAEFEPVRLVFVASGAGPFELAAGRPATSAAALPLATIAGTLGQRSVDDLPAASIGAPVTQAPSRGWLAALWPGASAPGRVTVLWAVLLAGVAALGAVAWTLLRQLRQDTRS